jgi:hypothetical protein
MPKYLFEFVDAQGKHGHDFVDAVSVDEAHRQVDIAAGSHGYREARLLDDDLAAQLREQRLPSHLDTKTLARVEAISRHGVGRWSLFLESLRANRWFLLASGTMLAAGPLLGWRLASYVGAAGLVLHVVLFVSGSKHSGLYNELLRASAFGDWDKVFVLADRMQPAREQSSQIAFDLDVRRAMAMAATQRLDQGLALVNQWESRNPQPRGIYWGRRAGVFAKAGDYANFIACMRRSFEESNEAIWARIDLALAIARVGDDPHEALELLRHQSIATQPPSTARFVHWARGVALMRIGDIHGAELSLAQAVDGFMTQAENPAVWSSLALASGALAVAGSMNGRKDQARALLTPLRPIFDVYADPALVALVKQHML